MKEKNTYLTPPREMTRTVTFENSIFFFFVTRAHLEKDHATFDLKMENGAI